MRAFTCQQCGGINKSNKLFEEWLQSKGGKFIVRCDHCKQPTKVELKGIYELDTD